MASSINKKHFAMNKRRLDGLELEDGKKRKKVKTNNKDGNGHPLASSYGDQLLAVKAEINPTRTLSKRELRELKNLRKKDIQPLLKQKPAEVRGIRLAPANRANRLDSKGIPYKLELKNAKHEEGRLKREQGAGMLIARNKALESAGGRTRRRKFIRDTKNNQDMADNYSWTLSYPVGGQMLGLDPIFSRQEEYLLIPYDTAIHVYATLTSLLVRSLRVSGPDRVSAFALSSTDPNSVFISTNLGSIERWDWTEGKRLEYWNISAPIYSLATMNLSIEKSSDALVYTVDRKGEGPWMLTVHRLLGGLEASKTDLGTLLKYSEPLTFIKILDSGRVIVVTSGQRLIMGTCERPNLDSLKDVSYVWRDIDCPERITSVDVRLRPYDSKKPRVSKAAFHGAIDVAVGTLKGKIIVYDDLVGNLLRIENGTKGSQENGANARFLHWHRTAVLALKWSADGNYIISGGLETVLVLWQLETGQKQFLPHLSASIESIVVSPSGTSYCIRLADNSAMIVSTSELQPTFSVAGIQLPAKRKAGIHLPFFPTVDGPTQGWVSKTNTRFPAVVSPLNPGQLLLAVPSSTTSGLITKSQNSCYLQTFDILSAHQISKQALTRTKDTIVNIGPELNHIEEPDVIHMQISHDARWLATVDEWVPPGSDLTILAFNRQREAEEQLSRREVYLKIWRWDRQSKRWELSSRIDKPHSTSRGTILDLASDPSSAGFATIGDDYTLRIWKPSVRQRNGRGLSRPDGKISTKWQCRSLTHLEEYGYDRKVNQPGAKLAYSLDGSIIATGYCFSSASTIHLVNVITGTVTRTLSNLYTGPLIGLGILQNFLIILSNELRVWDLVAEDDSFVFKIQTYGLDAQKRLNSAQLAINTLAGTFAVSLPEQTQSSKMARLKSRVIVFDPKTPQPLYEAATQNPTTLLLSTRERSGYYIVDDTAQVSVLSPRQVTAAPFEQPSREEVAFCRGLENIFGARASTKQKETSISDSEEALKASVPPSRLLAMPKDDQGVSVSLDKLAELFDTGSAFTLPPIKELFGQVASLFSRKLAI